MDNAFLKEVNKGTHRVWAAEETASLIDLVAPFDSRSGWHSSLGRLAAEGGQPRNTTYASLSAVEDYTSFRQERLAGKLPHAVFADLSVVPACLIGSCETGREDHNAVDRSTFGQFLTSSLPSSSASPFTLCLVLALCELVEELGVSSHKRFLLRP